jgi:hypothetical protein
VIVEGGELIDAGRGFPGEDAVGVAGAEKRFVSEPVKFSDTVSVSARSGIPGMFESYRQESVHFGLRHFLHMSKKFRFRDSRRPV